METLLEKYISLDKCPSCESSETFHAHHMRNYREGVSNTFGIRVKESSINDRESILWKQDLCLECGHTWVMFIQHVLLTEREVLWITQVREEMQSEIVEKQPLASEKPQCSSTLLAK